MTTGGEKTARRALPRRLHRSARPASPSASAIVVNYNSGAYLGRCVESLLRADVPGGMDILVFDNASTDGSLRGVHSRRDRLRIVRSPRNLGFAAANNLAARMVRGRVLLLVNPDARVRADTPARLVWHIHDLLGPGCVGAKVVGPGGVRQPTGRKAPTALTALFGRTSALSNLFPSNSYTRAALPCLDHWDESEPLEVDWITGQAMAVRRDVFMEAGGFDERFYLYWEDADLCRRLRARGYRNYWAPDTLVWHHAGRCAQSNLLRANAHFHAGAFRYLEGRSTALRCAAAMALAWRAGARGLAALLT